MGETIKVSFFFSQPIQKDITYLVSYHLQLCICVTARGGLLALCPSVQVLTSKPGFIDFKQR